MRKKSLIRRLIPWIFLAAVIGGLIYLGIQLYGQKPETHDRLPTISYYDGKSKKLTISNDYLEFELDPATTQFTVKEKESGRVWRSNPEGADKDPIASGTYKEELLSTLKVTYNDSSGTEKKINNYTKSIKNEAYTVEQPEENGPVYVHYCVGDIDKPYTEPIAMTEERYNEIKEMLSSKDRKKLTAYKMFSLDTIKNKEDRDSLTAQFPELQNQPLYIRLDLVPGNGVVVSSAKQALADMLGKNGYTEEDYEKDMEIVAIRPDGGGAVFNITMVYKLDGPDLIVEIPYEDIYYKPDYPLTYISPLPVFNAVAGTGEEAAAAADAAAETAETAEGEAADAEPEQKQQRGFLLIPEGGGAIIYYGNGKLSQNPYYANLYGWDYAMERKEAISETENAFPVFGATSGDASYICIIEGASSYGGVNADIAGEGHTNNFNTIGAQYTVLHAAPYSVSNKTAKAFYVYEDDIPKDTVVQRYCFIGSSNYADMANAYGDYLRKHVEKLADAQAGEDMPINVELIGAINKRVVKFGVPVDSVVPTTTFEQARKILDELADEDIKSLSVRMTGWSNGGIRQEVLTSVHAISSLGGEREMKSLISEARLKNVDLYFDGITCFAYHSGMTDGFIPFRDAARYATRDQVHLYPYNIVNGQIDDDEDDYYLVKPSYAQKCASNLIEKLSDLKSAGIAFRDIGKLLSADYYPKDLVTREMVKQMNIGTMEEAAQNGMKVMIKEGNDYAVPYADRITDMNLTGQAYGIVDERIPFYQIALHGMKDYTGEPINLSGDYKTMLLECAEYGAGLNFTFMAEETRVLRDSVYSEYTSAGYSFWKDDVIQMIKRYQAEMSGLNQRRITNHERLEDTDVTVTTYDGGTKVYVNYGEKDFIQGDIMVPARDYLVVKGEE